MLSKKLAAVIDARTALVTTIADTVKASIVNGMTAADVIAELARVIELLESEEE